MCPQAGAAPGVPVVGRDARACRRRGSSPGSQASREVAGQVGTVDGVGQTLAVRDGWSISTETPFRAWSYSIGEDAWINEPECAFLLFQPEHWYQAHHLAAPPRPPTRPPRPRPALPTPTTPEPPTTPFSQPFGSHPFTNPCLTTFPPASFVPGVGAATRQGQPTISHGGCNANEQARIIGGYGPQMAVHGCPHIELPLLQSFRPGMPPTGGFSLNIPGGMPPGMPPQQMRQQMRVFHRPHTLPSKLLNTPSLPSVDFACCQT